MGQEKYRSFNFGVGNVVARKVNLNDLPREDGSSDHDVAGKEAFERDLSLFLEKSSRDLQHRECEVITARMVLSGLSETEEALAWDVRNLGVDIHSSYCCFNSLNFRSRVLGPVL